MICTTQTQNELTAAIGQPLRADTPTWNNHLYTCRYQLDGGSLLMSVKELSNAAETTSYFDGLARALGNAHKVDGLGEEAFITSNGSVVVQKDRKVLLVDDSMLPAQLNNPPLKPPALAYTATKTILGCWTGA